ncbi:lipoprotein [Staphylococcus aureus]|nr:lipoprotein [Staphylococcus aureus]
MKFKAIVAITLSLSLLTACGANQHKENSSKSNDTNKKTQQTDNTTQSNTEKQMTPQEAEDIVRNDYKARGVNEYQTLNYKTNLERSNEHEYYVEHLVRDAVGTPLKRCAIVNRHNGTIINIFDDMSEKDKEEFEAFKKRSPKYNPGMNNHDETDGESEDIHIMTLIITKQFKMTYQIKKSTIKMIKMLLIKKKNMIMGQIILKKLKLNNGIL